MSRDLPPTVAEYLDSMTRHDWAALRACLTDDFERVGPYAEHVFPDPEGYVAFLAELLPTITDHTVSVDRALAEGDRCYVEVTERLTTADGPLVSRVCMAVDLAPDGRLRRVEAFLRRTT
ncbi:MAG: nuclear transport factor 2 family protein [Acidimicrobiia bacterium]|jgi:ketosteroid isomerase-like protein